MGDAAQRFPWQDEAWLERTREFARELGLEARHDGLLVRALTHRSLADEAPEGDNERLEFLGDSVLALLVNEHLYQRHPDYAEGRLTKLKTRYVSEPCLAAAAAALDLGSRLAIAAPDEAAGGRARASTLSDTYEAVLASLYLACGLEAAREWVQRTLIAVVDPTEVWDHKSRLQELLQEKRRITPTYITEVESGPAHDRQFRARVLAGEELLAEGSGRTKKQAEQAAAAAALGILEKPKRRRRSVTRRPSRGAEAPGTGTATTPDTTGGGETL